MKVAPIPPVSLLRHYAFESYHLALLVECQKSQDYCDFYAERSIEGKHVILDNSAHELGHSRDLSRLLAVAETIRPAEVVLPDRLFFGDDTAKMSQEAALEIGHYFPEMGLMGVPQGRTIYEWSDCLNELLKIQNLTTIGISKDYEVWQGGLRYLVSLVPTKIPIHMLGLGRSPQGLKGLARDYPNVRGIDTAKPFVYAASRIQLGVTLHTPEYPRRSEDYFNLDADSQFAALSMHNWENFKTSINQFVAYDLPLVDSL